MRHALTVLKLRIVRSWWLMLLVAIVGTGVGVGLSTLDLFGINDAENGAMDSGMQFWLARGQVAPAAHTALVAIDQHSFDVIAANPSYVQAFGSWPFQRTLWVRVFNELTKLGARAIVFDATLTEAQSDPTNDENLRAAITQGHLPVYLPFSTNAQGMKLPRVKAENRLPPGEPAHGRKPVAKKKASTAALKPRVEDAGVAPAGSFEDAFPAEAPPTLSVEELDHQHREQVARALAFPVTASGMELARLLGADGTPDYIVPPIAPLLEACPGYGLATQEADADGRMRTTHFAYSDGANAYVTLGVAVVADLFRAASVTLEPGRLSIGTHAYAINADGTGRLRYDGTIGQRYPAPVTLVDVLDSAVLREQGLPPRVDPKRIQGRVVLIGGFATGTNDFKLSPVDGQVPGVLKHAAEIESLLSEGFIVDTSYGSSVALAFFVALISAMVIMVVKSPLLEIGFPIALFFLFFLGPGYVLVHHHLHILSAVPSMAGSIASVAATVSNHLFAEHDREMYRETFGRYMERSLVDQLVEGRRLPPLDGVTQPVTAFFSDIRGFSTFSETFRDDPKVLMRILNTYLTCVTNVLVNEERATLDKYVGDSVIALFNAPLAQPDHALRGCRAALKVQAAIGTLRDDFRARGWPDVYTRIGLNTGLMTVGNLGSEQLVDYTAIGDEMNLAARLEGANKAYGTLIMMGPGTYEAVKDDVDARELDRVLVPGKHLPVTVYELIGMKGGMSAEKAQVVALYASALEAYRGARFAEAVSSLDEALSSMPEDGPSLALKERCAQQLKTEPGPSFDPVQQLHK